MLQTCASASSFSPLSPLLRRGEQRVNYQRDGVGATDSGLESSSWQRAISFDEFLEPLLVIATVNQLKYTCTKKETEVLAEGKHNVCDWVTEHTRDIEHYLQDEKQDHNSTTQPSDRRKSVFKESGGWADRINRKKKKSNHIH